MRPIQSILLVTGIALAACAHVAESPPAPAASLPPAATITATPFQAAAPPAAATPEAPTLTAESAAPLPTLQVTPRGDALEATDPRTVVIGNGQPVLVEFFAFW